MADLASLRLFLFFLGIISRLCRYLGSFLSHRCLWNGKTGSFVIHSIYCLRWYGRHFLQRLGIACFYERRSTSGFSAEATFLFHGLYGNVLCSLLGNNKGDARSCFHGNGHIGCQYRWIPRTRTVSHIYGNGPGQFGRTSCSSSISQGFFTAILGKSDRSGMRVPFARDKVQKRLQTTLEKCANNVNENFGLLPYFYEARGPEMF